MKRALLAAAASLLLLLCSCAGAQEKWTVSLDGRQLPFSAILADDTLWIPAAEIEKELGIERDSAITTVVSSVLCYPLKAVCGNQVLSMLEDPERRHVYCTSGILDWDIPAGYSVPVLMYHGVSDDVWGDESMFLSPSDMEDHLRYLTDNGYDPIWFEDLKNVDQYDKPVILTFDDGYLCNYTTLYPMLQKYNVKVTISIVTSSMDNRTTSMTSQMVRELADSGLVSIQSHTVNHKVLSECDPETKEYEILRSKLEVARITGREPMLLCYPRGGYDDQVLQITGGPYSFAATVETGTYVTGSDQLLIPRYGIYRGISLEQFISMMESIDYLQSEA